MSFDGAGSYSQPANTAAVPNNIISPAAFNTLIADIAAALSKMICKDGQSTPSANIPFGGNRITNVGNATALTDAATLDNVIKGTGVFCVVGGSVDVVTLTPTPAWTAYAAGQMVLFFASGANTGSVTLNVSGLGAITVKKNGTASNLAGGDIPAAGALVLAVYHTSGVFVTKV